jgi:hypothetical protein
MMPRQTMPSGDLKQKEIRKLDKKCLYNQNGQCLSKVRPNCPHWKSGYVCKQKIGKEK